MVFHDKLMKSYNNRVIKGCTICLEEGYIEMGIAVGALMSLKRIEDSVEL